jgi:hypothetical protein
VFSGTKEIRIGQKLPRLRELMTQLRAIGGQIIKPGENQETHQASIGRSSTVGNRCWAGVTGRDVPTIR